MIAQELTIVPSTGAGWYTS